jgi:hypothetical protein
VTLRRRLAAAAGLAVAAAVAWWLPPLHSLVGAVLAVPASSWTAATVALAASYLLRAWRLRDEWRGRIGLGMRDALHLTLLHSAALNLLPLRSGEAGYPLLLWRRHGVALPESAASLLWLRVQDSVVLGSAAACLLLLPGPLPWRVAAALAAVALWAWWLPAVASLAIRSLAAAAGTPGMLRRGALRVLGVVRCGSVTGWACTAGHWSAKLGASVLLLQALVDLPTASAWSGAALGEVAAALPLQAPAGFGAYEAGVWLGAQHGGSGAAAPALLGAALNVHLFVIVFALAGAALSQCGLWLAAPLRQSLS